MSHSFQKLADTILNEIGAVVGLMDENEIRNMTDAILDAKRIFVTAEGRTGLLVRAFAMRLMQMGLEVFVIGETITPNVKEGDLLIAVSGSGETATTLAVVESSLPKNINLWVITASRESKLAGMASGMLYIPGQTKERSQAQITSIQPLSNLFGQALIIALDIVGLLVMQSRGEADQTMQERHSIV
jgi:6-phospho-3-hexuloisomerase